MPIFEYECQGCGREFELLLLPKSPEPVCPHCESSDLEKLISRVGVSSDGIRAANRAKAMKKSRAIQQDKAHEDHKEFHKELDADR